VAGPTDWRWYARTDNKAGTYKGSGRQGTHLRTTLHTARRYAPCRPAVRTYATRGFRGILSGTGHGSLLRTVARIAAILPQPSVQCLNVLVTSSTSLPLFRPWHKTPLNDILPHYNVARGRACLT